ncbi:nucleolar protein 14 [Cunninghamella echinulata]|nr:nucleolar protein 14 [Cunninghamella echinulata]
MHFGGFDDDKNETEDSDRPKSKNEIMKEIIAKSKLHKYERQMAKQEDEEIRADLDEELNDIRSLLDTNKRKPLPSQTNLFARAENERKESEANQQLEKEKKLDDNYEDYDKALRELAFDKRAQATDRTKTEEEIALEEKENLEKAERARKRRMEGLDSESEDEDGGKSYKHGHKKQRKKGAPQGDDLDDDYLEELEEEESKKLGGGLTLEDIQSGKYNFDDDLESDEDEDEDDEDGEDDEDDEDDDEEEESDVDDLEGDEIPHFDDDDDDDMNELSQNGKITKSIKKSTKASTTNMTKESSGEIPYTFECPLTHSEFLSIMNGLQVEDALIVIKRIRILYHVKLSPENKQKISSFLGVIVDHLGYVSSTVSPLPTTLLEKLCEHIFEMAQQVPEAASEVFSSKVKKMHHDMSQKMKNGNGKSSCLPDVEDITILRSLCQVFSTSDLNHLIATPALLFMAQALAQCPIHTELDIGRGIFLTQLFLEYQAVAKRFVPEALNFLQQVLVLLSPKSLFKKSIPGRFPLSENHSSSLHITNIKAEGLEHIPTITLDQFVVEDEDNNNNDQLKLSLLQATLRILEKYLQLYASTPALIEVFEPTLLLISEIQTLGWHEELQSLITTLQERLQRQIKFCKEKRLKTPLRMQQHRPIPIAQHLPKFEKAYSMDKHYDPDHERSATAKLQAQLKKEKKGAMRELRKDNMFIARENAKIKKQKDEEYNKMVKGVMSILESDQAEKNRLEREKKKK